MAQQAPPLFQFYFRYSWDEENFAVWQESMVNLQRGAMEGLFSGAVLQGLDVAAVTGMQLQVAPGLAVGPTGYFMVQKTNTPITFSPPVSNPRLDLIVIRPKLVSAVPITRPTYPFDQVPLQTLQDCQVLSIQGIESPTPSYPAKGANDTIVCGVRLTAGMSGFTGPAYDCDFNVRDIMGANSQFQNNFGRYDDRLRPYRVSSSVFGIKPSQLINPNSRAFSFVNKTNPSIYPKSGGNYNHADTFLDFNTGVISGGDATSPAFTPQFPTAGNFMNVVIAITASDLLQISYGTLGTHTQCIDGIKNQKQLGAGNVPSPTNAKLVAIVTIGSLNGTTISSLEFVDCRGQAATGLTNFGLATGGVTDITLPYVITSDDRGKVLRADTSAASGTIQLPSPNSSYTFSIVDKLGTFNTNKVRMVRAAAEKISNVAADYDLEAAGGVYHFAENGIDWNIL